MSINIDRVETLIITPDAFDQLGRDSSADFLTDTGEDTYEVPFEGDPPTAQEEIEILEARAASVTPPDMSIRPYPRKAHLLKALKTGAKVRMYRGGITTSQDTNIHSMGIVESRLGSAEINLKKSLERACGACAFRGACRLQGKPDAWLEAHPTKLGQVRNRQMQQSVPEFKESLDLDPMANCVPSKNVHHKRILAHS